MAIMTVSSRELNQDVGKAKRAARQHPVVITDRGKPAFVLLSYADYQRLASGRGRNLVDALAMRGLADIEFTTPKASIPSRPVDLF